MGRLSDDGHWWWDGTTWVPTAQVVLPQLPTRDPQRMSRAIKARQRLERYSLLYAANDASCVTSGLVIPLIPLFIRRDRAMRDYREWTLEQLALATTYLLGPDESMVAGETTLLPPGGRADGVARDLALAVTESHVLVFGIDSFEGQPRWIALAAAAADVTIEALQPFERLFREPALTVNRGDALWVIRGSAGVFKPGPVMDAWRQAASRSPRSGLSA